MRITVDVDDEVLEKAIEAAAGTGIEADKLIEERTYIVTLVDGDRIPAYPVIGKINEDGEFCFGSACQDKMWLVTDRMIESPLITECDQSRILPLETVS